jgi:anti-anti-sigma factor
LTSSSLPGSEAAGGDLDFSAPAFEIVAERRGPRQVCLWVSGELDLATAPQLRASLTDALSGTDGVVLDLGGVRFIDSTGLAAIIAGANAAEAAGASFQLATPLPDQAKRLLDLTGVSARLSFTAASSRPN